MKIVVLLLSLAATIYTQELLQQQLPQGGFRQIRKEGRAVPRYYICGAAVWKRRQMLPQPNRCWNHCNRRRNRWGKRYCSWETKCQGVPPVLGWIRTNGIRFQYCHFQNWDNQISLQDGGNWEWQGMQMCPQGQYVYGYRAKLTDRDGLAGLILLCRNIGNSRLVSERMVFDGEGPWRDVVASANFAVGYRVKYRDWYINGLALQMAGVPTIFAFNFNYRFPKEFNTVPTQIQKVVVNNMGTTQMRKEIELNKQREFQRIWQNQMGYLHGVYVTNSMSQTMRTKISMPFIKKTTEKTQSMSVTNREESTESFKFGTVETFKVGQKQKDVIFVPACKKYVIKQIVYSTDADVPYVLQIAYTNGIETEYQAINGVYKGVSVGEVETNVEYQNIC